ncbi:hypothetical protein TrLO_g15188 [Triparma laevis f. longispina]|uniref:Uncharacterized protein n=1 Tax=Triparma laevis f. longispina TaxID=1714387 RepID=A0A9W7FP74_9STRA|nr:hypothetical protein TrLO_g15188 [Triparma laevis f. longispina]
MVPSTSSAPISLRSCKKHSPEVHISSCMYKYCEAKTVRLCDDCYMTMNDRCSFPGCGKVGCRCRFSACAKSGCTNKMCRCENFDGWKMDDSGEALGHSFFLPPNGPNWDKEDED